MINFYNFLSFFLQSINQQRRRVFVYFLFTLRRENPLEPLRPSWEPQTRLRGSADDCPRPPKGTRALFLALGNAFPTLHCLLLLMLLLFVFRGAGRTPLGAHRRFSLCIFDCCHRHCILRFTTEHKFICSAQNCTACGWRPSPWKGSWIVELRLSKEVPAQV